MRAMHTGGYSKYPVVSVYTASWHVWEREGIEYLRAICPQDIQGRIARRDSPVKMRHPQACARFGWVSQSQIARFESIEASAPRHSPRISTHNVEWKWCYYV